MIVRILHRLPFRKLATISLSLIALGSLPLASHAVFGQEGQIQVLGFSSEAISEDMEAELAEGAASFSFSGGGGGFSFGSTLGGGVNPADRSQLLGLLSNESVRRELKLTDDQYTGAKQIMEESQKRLSDLIRKMLTEQKDGAIRLGGTAMRELQQENQKVAEAAIEEILLPEQMTRIRQLAYQVDVSQTGLGEALTEGKLGTDIGVHDDQKQNLLDRAAKIELEAKRAIAKIRAAARAKLFEELTPEQRKTAEELLGDYFLYEELTMSQQLRKSMKGLRRPAGNTEGDESKSY